MRENLSEVIKQSIDKALLNLNTILVGRIEKVNQATVNLQIVNKHVRGDKEYSYPTLIGVPVFFMQGGGSYTSYPLSVGDFCILLVCQNCIDRWFFGDLDKAPLEPRQFDLSDGIALVGINNITNLIPIPEKITQNGDLIQIGNIEHTGDTNQTGNIIVIGNITVNQIIVNGIDFSSHKHIYDGDKITSGPTA